MNKIAPVHASPFRFIRRAVLGLLAMSLAACVADGGASGGGKGRPRLVSYTCGSDGTLSVESLRTSVMLTEMDGTRVELPASPPAQTSRYGEAPYALVLEEKEALLMKNGREPLTCTR